MNSLGLFLLRKPLSAARVIRALRHKEVIEFEARLAFILVSRNRAKLRVTRGIRLANPFTVFFVSIVLHGAGRTLPLFAFYSLSFLADVARHLIFIILKCTVIARPIS